VQDVPTDYYRRLHEVDSRHWWHLGMREIEAALLRGRLHGSVLDAGCGTGGFLGWAASRGTFSRLAGVDISAEAIEIARDVAPSAELRVAPLDRLPFEDGEFDLAVSHDVLQHVPEGVLDVGLRELRRVLRPGGALLVRTNGDRRARRERDDWRAYDAATLAADLRRAGFAVRRVTYANTVLSLAESAPAAPTDERCGIPRRSSGARAAVGSALLRAESLLVGQGGRLPFGHTLFALSERELV
jgi:SAM-dependent methyltransferase